jgi:hypothetical protein
VIRLLTGAAATWPLAVRAQSPPKEVRVGTVSVINPRTASWWVGFDRFMRELGYVEGQNFALEFVNLNGRIERAGEEMKALVQRKVDIIIAPGPEVILKAAVAATDMLPIVMIAVDFDPLARGYVASLARPAGNVTGVFFQQIDLAAKRVEFLKQAFPELRAATVFWDRLSADQWQATQRAGAMPRADQRAHRHRQDHVRHRHQHGTARRFWPPALARRAQGAHTIHRWRDVTAAAATAPHRRSGSPGTYPHPGGDAHPLA